VANLANLIVTFSTIKLWVKVLKVPQPALLPIIFILCIVGTFALRNTFFDTGVMFCFGLLGYFMIKFQFPIIPLLLAIILGPNLEEHLRMALIISQGDYLIFITHPICLTFIILSIFSFFGPLVWPLWKNRKRAAETGS
jgi:putative tricarboxylic transport membrane protein